MVLQPGWAWRGPRLVPGGLDPGEEPLPPSAPPSPSPAVQAVAGAGAGQEGVEGGGAGGGRELSLELLQAACRAPPASLSGFKVRGWLSTVLLHTVLLQINLLFN